MKNKLINKIDLNLTKAEIEALISDVYLSLAFVVDTNHNDSDNDDLNIGEIRAKSLDTAGASELSDGIYKPLNSNISQYPLAGEFVVVLKTPLGRFYLSSINLFNSNSNNIDVKNTSGYVQFTDDKNISDRTIKSDKLTQKSVLENNLFPFNELPLRNQRSYVTNFGDVSMYGRFGNRIIFTQNGNGKPELFLQNDVSEIRFTNGSFSYIRKSENAEPEPDVNKKITSEYTGQQVYIDTDRIFANVGDEGIFFESSGLISVLSDENIFMNTNKNIFMEGNTINLGTDAEEAVIKGDTYLSDFEKLVESMKLFAQRLSSQDKILAISNAANNFLIDLENIGWDNFNKDNYLSEKVFIE